MSTERSPLLSPEREDGPATEASPLLGNQEDHTDGTNENDDSPPQPSPEPSRWFRWPRSNKPATKSKSTRRWPSIIAMIVLAVLVIVIILLGFLLPPAIKVYAEEASVIEPTGIQVEAIIPNGVRVRVQGNYHLDGERVKDIHSRRLGRFASIITRKLDTEPLTASLYLPQYDNALIGTAAVPALKWDVLEGHVNQMDFLADVTPGEAGDLRQIARDWLDGKIDQLKIVGSAPVPFWTGIIPLGTHELADSMVLEGQSLYRSFAALFLGRKKII